MSAPLQFDEATSRRVEATYSTGLGADYFFSLNRYLFLAVK
jgi:hypothetical protein